MQQIIVDFGTVELFGRALSLRIYGYGLMLVLGFLFAIYLAQWRAKRFGENPDVVVRCGILALIGGIVGARIAFVIERWDEQFAGAPLIETLNITSGGLIYYGGVALATAMVLAYLLWRRLPVRRYLDIIAPSLMLGLAFGRAGCLLNGCCYGGRCASDWALAMEFPMYSRPLVELGGGAGPFSEGTDAPSPPYAEQFYRADPVVHPDERLVNPYVPAGGHGSLHPPRRLHGALETDQLAVLFGNKADAKELFDALAGDGRLSEAEWKRGKASGDGILRGSEAWDAAIAFEASGDGQLTFNELWRYFEARRARLIARFDADEDGRLGADERAAADAWLREDLFALAAAEHAAAVRPAQPLGLINALLLAGLLLAFSRLRRREGQVFALLVVLYPVTRFCLESIRADNEHDVLKGVLTHNQYTSLILMTIGVVMWALLYTRPASAGPTWRERLERTGERSARDERA